MSLFDKIGEKIAAGCVAAGIATADTVKVDDTVSTAPPVLAPASAGTPYVTTGITGAVNAELMAALMANINKSVSPNNLQALDEMADTLKAAILDEGTRIKAAAAALKLSYADINGTIDQLISAVTGEKNNFLGTDVKAMETSINTDLQTLETTKKRIEEVLVTLNDLTTQRDSLTANITQQQADQANAVKVFDVTTASIVAALEEQRKKIQVYLPQGVIK